jgi:hypothetical protein
VGRTFVKPDEALRKDVAITSNKIAAARYKKPTFVLNANSKLHTRK